MSYNIINYLQDWVDILSSRPLSFEVSTYSDCGNVFWGPRFTYLTSRILRIPPLGSDYSLVARAESDCLMKI